jgi:hypothetical protein
MKKASNFRCGNSLFPPTLRPESISSSAILEAINKDEGVIWEKSKNSLSSEKPNKNIRELASLFSRYSRSSTENVISMVCWIY